MLPTGPKTTKNETIALCVGPILEMKHNHSFFTHQCNIKQIITRPTFDLNPSFCYSSWTALWMGGDKLKTSVHSWVEMAPSVEGKWIFFKYISNVTVAFSGRRHHLTPTDGEAHKTDDALAASHVTEYIQERNVTSNKNCFSSFFFFSFFFLRLQCILYTLHLHFSAIRTSTVANIQVTSKNTLQFVCFCSREGLELIHSANEGKEAS